MLQEDFVYAGKGSKNDFSTNSNILRTWSPFVCIQLFRERCRKKSCNNPKRWMVLSSLFFKEMWKNGMRGHELTCMFASAKGKQQKLVGLTVSVSGTVHWSYPILPFGIVASKFFATTFLEIVCINGISRALASSLIQYPYPVVQTAEFRVGHMFLCYRSKFKTQVTYFICILIFSFSNGGKMKNHNIIVTNPKRSRQGLLIIIFVRSWIYMKGLCYHYIFNYFLE